MKSQCGMTEIDNLNTYIIYLQCINMEFQKKEITVWDVGNSTKFVY